MTEIAKYPGAPEATPQASEGTQTQSPHPGSYATPGYYSTGQQDPSSSQGPYGGYPSYQGPPPPLNPTGGEPPFGGVPTPNDGRDPRKPWFKRTFVIVAAVAVLAGGAGGIAGAEFSHNGTTTVVSSLSSGSGTGTATSASTSTASKVAAAVTPSVVEIEVTGAAVSDIGSGVILSSTGLILTNNHVVAAASSANGGGTIKVVFSNGKTASATIVATDANSDLALVKAQSVSGLTPAQLGDSSTVQVGDTVMAIGAPEGLQNTVTLGIVSALNRTVTVASDTNTNQYDPFSGQTTNSTVTYSAIQTDASLNPGNSGGPLVNMAGQIVGVNSAIYSPTNTFGGGSGGSVGLGFSIPINKVKQIVAQMEQSSGVSS